MTTDEAIDTMALAFVALPVEGLRALAWHLRNGTPILCGKDSEKFIDGIGGA